jgi:hypothetical protein
MNRLTESELALVALHMRELIEANQDDYDPETQRAVALASSVVDKLRR